MRIKSEIADTLPKKSGEVVTEYNYSIGDPVMRGPDWNYSDQDGGAGNVGVISRDYGPGWIVVIWNMNSNGAYCYRIGFNDAHDLIFAE